MTTYAFSFRVQPTETNPDRDWLAGAYAHLMIQDASPKPARAKAVHYLSQHGWWVLSEEHAYTATPQIAAQTEEMLSLYERAQLDHIACTLTPWPKSNAG